MKKTYITSEFKLNGVNGVNNINEKSNFFSSILINIPDNIEIIHEDFIWYENFNGEQINIDLESNFNPKYYSSSSDKKDNHIIYLKPNQSEEQLNMNAIWYIEINIKQLLFNYIYSRVRQSRTFEGLTQNSIEINYNSFIEKYINLNLTNKFKFDNLQLYIKNVDIKYGIRYKSIWNDNLTSDYLYNKYNILNSGDILKVEFNQENSLLYFNEYYYSLNLKRI